MVAAALLGVTSAPAATYQWTGNSGVNQNYDNGANWVEGSWAQWSDYVFNGNVVNGTVNINVFCGTDTLSLQSGLTTDITINGPVPLVFAGNWGHFGTISIAADSRNLTINTSINSSGEVTWNVGAGRTLTFTQGLSDWGTAPATLVKSGAGTAMLTGSSSYSGVTILAGGVVNAATFANNGTASSLGVGTGDTAGDNIGLLFRGGVLQYTGSTAQSTDRAIRLSTTGGGGTIDASGSIPSATLSFTRASMPNWWEEGGVRTLTLTGLNTGENTLSAGIADTAGTKINLTKSGVGTWVLAGAGNYVGVTNINAGTLIAASSGALGTGGLDGATMTWISNGATLALRGDISMNEHLHVLGTGVGGLGAIRNLAGANALTMTIGLDGDTTIGVNAGTLTLTNALYGDGALNASNLTKVGNGVLVLSGTNLYSGVTVFAGGVVQATTLADNGTASSLGVGTGDPGGDSIGLLFRGGALRYAGTMTQTTNRAIRLSTSGGGGTIDASGSVPSATLTFTRASMPNWWESPGVRTLTLTGINTGENTLAAGINDIAGATTINVSKEGTGTWVLAGAGNYLGITNINAGVLLVTNSTSLGVGGWDGTTMTNVLDGATLALRGGISLDEHMHVWGAGVGGLGAIRSLSGNNALTIGGNNGTGFALRSNTVVGVDADTLTVTGFYESGGSFGLTKVGSGTLVLTANNAYTGGTTINRGTLQIGNGSGGSLAGGSAVVIAAGARLVNGTTNGNSLSLGALTLTGGELAATNTPAWDLGNYLLRGDVTIGGSVLSTISADVHVGFNEDRLFTVADVDGGSGVDLLISGKLSHYNNNSWGYATKAGAGTMKISGVNDIGRLTVNAGLLILENDGVGLLRNGGLINNATTDFSVVGTKTASYAISGSGSLSKSGNGTLVLTGNNSFLGGITINAGTLQATRSTLGSGAVVVNNGGTLYANDQWVFCGVNGYNEAQRNVASVTLTAGAVLYLDPTTGFANGITHFFLTGGSVTGGANDDTRGALFLFNGNEQITASGGVVSAIGVSIGLNGNNNSITVDAGSQLDLTNVLKRGAFDSAGRGGFVKNGGGTLVLSGANNYDGVTDITAGTLIAASNTALGAGGHSGETMSYIRDGATLALQGGVSLDEHFHIWGAGVGGLGALRSLSGDNSLTIGGNNGNGFALRSNTVVGVDAGTLTVTGFYEDQGSFGLTKVGAGTLVLTAVNAHTGGTTVNAGTLSLAGNDGYGRLRGTLTINAGGTVVTTGDGTGLGYRDQLNTLVINGGLLDAAPAAHIWNLTGGVTMTGGEIRSAGNGSLQWNRTSLTTNASATSAVISGGTLALRNDSGYGNLDINVADGAADADLLISASISGSGVSITKTGAGKLRLTGSGNSYSGATIVNGGMLELPDGDWVTGQPWNASGARGALTIGAGATLSTSSGVTQFHNGLTLNGGTLSSRGLTYAGGWRNVVLSSDVSAGGAAVSTIASHLNLDGARTFTVGDGSDLQITSELGSANLTAGSLTKAGAGVMTLTANNTYTGGTAVNAGRLVYQGNYASGSHTVASGAVLQFDIASGSLDGASTSFSGVGTFRKTGAGELRWGASVATFGLGSGSLIDVQAGTLTAGSNANENWSANLSDLNVESGATFSTVEANVRVNRITGAGTISSGYSYDSGYRHLAIGVDNGSSTFAGVLANGVAPANLRKEGTGTITLSGANTYSGVTDIVAGTLVAASSTALGVGGHNGGTMSWIYDGATLALQGGVSLDEHFHVWGSGVGGLGAIRSLSGSNALTNAPGGGPGFALRSNTVVGVDAGTLTASGFYEHEGSFTLTKVGAGTLVLTAESTHTGGTVVDAGTLSLAGSNGYGRLRGALTINAGATVVTTGDGTGLGFYDQLNTLVVNGGLYEAAGSSHIWNLTGGVAMTGGEIRAAGGSLQWNRSNLTTNASATSAVISGSLNLRRDWGYATWSVTVADGAAAADLLVSAAITEGNGSVGLLKAGAGTMVLSHGANTFSGGTTVSAGTLVIDAQGNQGGSALGANRAVSVASGATLRINQVDGLGWFGANPSSLTIGGTMTIAAGIHASIANHGITLDGGTLTSEGAGDGAGNYILDGTLATLANAASSVVSAHTVLLRNGSGTDQSVVFNVADGAAATDLLVSAALANGAGANGLVKSGSGALSLSGANTYTGGTTLSSGTLEFASGSLGASGAVTVASGVLRWASGNTEDISARLALTGAASLDTNGNDVTLASALSGNQALTKAGSGALVLGGANSGLSSAWTVVDGTLRAGHDQAFGTGQIRIEGGVVDLAGFDIGNTFALAGGAIATGSSTVEINKITLASTGANRLSGRISGMFNAAERTIDATGDLALVDGLMGHNATFTGGLVTLESSALHSPGNSPGLQTFGAGLAYAGNSTLEWELNFDHDSWLDYSVGPVRGTDYDGIDVTGGALTIGAGATFQLALVSGLTFDLSDSFWDFSRTFQAISVASGQIGGTFDLDAEAANLLAAGEGVWDLVYTANGVAVTWTPVPEPSTYGLALGGLCLAAAALRRRSRRA